MTDMMTALVAQAAAKLEYTTEDLAQFCEDHEAFSLRDSDRDFCRRLDALIFQCKTCSWWKRQRENATPDAAQWQCQECFDEEKSR